MRKGRRGAGRTEAGRGRGTGYGHDVRLVRPARREGPGQGGGGRGGEREPGDGEGQGLLRPRGRRPKDDGGRHREGRLRGSGDARPGVPAADEDAEEYAVGPAAAARRRRGRG